MSFPVNASSPPIALLLPACLPPLPLCSEGRPAVTQGWHRQKKKVAWQQQGRDAVALFTLYPLASCAHYLLVFRCPAERGLRDRLWKELCPPHLPLLWLIRTGTNLGGGERVEKSWGWIREEWHSEMPLLPVACQLLFLPSSLQEEQAVSPWRASLPLCISMEKLVLPQHAVISRG